MSFIISLTFLYIGIKNNNQGEFYNFETGNIDFGYILFFISSSFIVSFIVFLFIYLLLKYIYSIVKFRK